MPRIAIASLLLCLGVAGPVARAAEPAAAPASEERLEAARRYLAVMTPLAMMEEVSLTTFRGLPPVEAHELAKAYVRELDMRVVEAAMLESLARNFSVAEIDALTAFYASRHGRSAMEKMNDYMADLMPAMQGEMHRALAVVRAQQDQQLAQPLPAPSPGY